MKRYVSRMIVGLAIGVACVGALIVKYAGSGRAALAGNFVAEPRQSAITNHSANVELVGHFMGEGDLGHIVIQGNYAYIKENFTPTTCFHILDISDPANPVEVGSYDLPNCYSFDAYGSYVYVLRVAENFQLLMHIIDVSNPANPVEVGVFLAYHGPGPMAVFFPYVYFNTTYHDPHGSVYTMYIVDVTNPVTPTLVNMISSGIVSTIHFNEPYAYLTFNEPDSMYPCFDQQGFKIFDITDPGNPAYISDVPVVWVNDSAITGHYAYIWGSEYLDNIDCSGGFIYNALFIEDISDPYHPAQVNVFQNITGEIKASKDYLYLGTGVQLKVFSIANPVVPNEIGFFTIPGGISDFTISGGYIYITADGGGLYILRLTHTLSGQVTDANRIPYPGVYVEASNGLSMTVGVDGYYTFTNVLTGTYTVTPTLPGYAFMPASRSLTVPSYEALAADFAILPLPVTVTLTPGMTTTLTLTDTQGLTTTLFFPAGAVTETVSLTLTSTPGTSQLSWVFAGHAFDLTASHEGVPVPDFAFSVPVTVTIHYSNVDVRLVRDEGQLTLWEWVGNTWQDAVQVCDPLESYHHDEVDNVVTLRICRTGNLKLMGPTYPVFLPVITMP
jgi:hypothetical protein